MAFVDAPKMLGAGFVGQSPATGILFAQVGSAEQTVLAYDSATGVVTIKPVATATVVSSKFTAIGPGGEQAALGGTGGTTYVGSLTNFPVNFVQNGVARLEMSASALYPATNLSIALGSQANQYSWLYASSARFSGASPAIEFSASGNVDLQMSANGILRIVNAAYNTTPLIVNPATSIVTVPVGLAVGVPLPAPLGFATVSVGGPLTVAAFQAGINAVVASFVNTNSDGSVFGGLYVLSNGIAGGGAGSVTLAASGESAKTMKLAVGENVALTITTDLAATFAGFVSIKPVGMAAIRQIKAADAVAGVPSGARILYVDG